MYHSLIRPLLFRLEAEAAHDLALAALKLPGAAALAAGWRDAPREPVRLWGLTFRNPLGLAAGFDKNAVAVAAWPALGFGFCEVGTVTSRPQPGNPRPRIFRCPEARVLVNRMGFPNDGAEAVAARLAKRRRAADFPVGVNLGKLKDTPIADAAADYLQAFRVLYDHGDFFVINISSPNTPGLRELEDANRLAPVLAALQEENRRRSGKPLLVKISPDLTWEQLAAVLALAQDQGLTGIVATNTTLRHGDLPLHETGGLSGRPLAERANEVVRFIHRETAGRLPIIGVGGVMTREDYLARREAGAALVQVYTGFVYGGPGTAWRLLAS